MIERTLSIIKPDAVSKNVIGAIIDRFEKTGFRVVSLQMKRLTKREAEQFYAEHKERPFFDSLTSFICSGLIVVMVLEGEGAIAKNRDLMGATDPKKATQGTLRADYGTSIEANVVHGSDSPSAAEREIAFFFGSM